MKSLINEIRTWLFEYDAIIFIVSLLATGFVNQILSKWQTIRTFYAQDATLWNEYTGDTIQTGAVFAIIYFVLAPLIYMSERYRLRHNKTLSESRKKSCAIRLSVGLLSCTMISILLIELGKGYVGRLRPSFAWNCLSPSTPPYQNRVYTSDEDCPTADRHSLHDGRRSFPSGHASLAVSGAAYGQLTFTRIARSADVVGDVAAILFVGLGWVWFLFAAWVSASRIFDNAHHVGDVAVGALVGVWCAAVHFWFVTGRNEAAQISDLAMLKSADEKKD